MSFVIYNKNTTLILCDRPSWQNQDYATKQAASAALTRIEKKLKEKPDCSMARWSVFEGKPFDRSIFAIAESTEFYKTIEKKETKRNLLSNREFTQGVNTPAYLDPSTETYHCM